MTTQKRIKDLERKVIPGDQTKFELVWYTHGSSEVTVDGVKMSLEDYERQADPNAIRLSWEATT